MIDVKLIKKPKNNGAASDSGIATNGNGYNTGSVVKEAMHAARADLAIYADNAGNASETMHAKEADRAEIATDLAPDSPARTQFLSRLVDDIAKGHITFEQGLNAIGRAIFSGEVNFGKFIASLYGGTGAGIDSNGNAEFQSVKVRSFFECLELITNRVTTIDGDVVLTESDIVENTEWLGGHNYRLQFRSKWDGYTTAQCQGNILRGIYNNIDQNTLTLQTSWCHIISMDYAENSAVVEVYPPDQVPDGISIAPLPGMVLARWGNTTDTTRQSSIYLSSIEGRIIRLVGVNSPILTAANYGATFGTVPEFLKTLGLPLAQDQDYVYARGLIVQDMLRVDYQGKPVPEYIDRGDWGPGENYYCRAINPVTKVWEISEVWHNGAKYRCLINLTDSEPYPSSPYWQQLLTSGEKGATMRGPQQWDSLPEGYAFECGISGNRFIDVVMHNGYTYTCIAPHLKNNATEPGTTGGDLLWQLGDSIELVAARLLLSEYALVRNLGVESVEMRDKSGNIVFLVKDGVVTCNSGTFQQIQVTGELTATSLNLALSTNNPTEDPNGSVCLNRSVVTLPQVSPGAVRIIRVLNPKRISNYTPQSLTLVPADDFVGISVRADTTSHIRGHNVVLNNCGFNSGAYLELVGYCYSDGEGGTDWHVIQLSTAQ